MKRCRSVLQRGCFRLFVFALKWSVRPRVMGILSNHPGWCCAQVGDALRCPASKFITHTLSNLTFLILLTAATFRLGDNIHPITTTEDLIWNRFDSLTYDEQVDYPATQNLLTYLFLYYLFVYLFIYLVATGLYIYLYEY